MGAVLYGRARSIGPCLIALASLLLIAFSFYKFQHRFMWETLPFPELHVRELRSQKSPAILERHENATHLLERHAYVQPELVEPES